MKPHDFPQKTTVFAKDQPPYVPLPAHVYKDGMVTTLWKMSFRERFKVLFSGCVWLQILTFNKPLQPVSLFTDDPFEEES